MGRRLVAKKMIKFYILHLSRARRFACECNERGARSVTVHRWPCHLVCALITSEHASWESSSEIRCRVRRIGYDHVVIWSAYSLYFSETRNDRSSPPRKHSRLFVHCKITSFPPHPPQTISCSPPPPPRRRRRTLKASPKFGRRYF